MTGLRDIRSAIALLTLFPVGEMDGRGRPVAWFPWVGWLFGGSALLVAWAARRVEGDLGALLVAAVIVFVWAVESRLLHWDGLADTADAMWGGHTAQRRLEIMRDSRSGAFAIIAVVMVALLQVTSIAMIVSSGNWWALVAAPVLGRFSASLGLWSTPPAHSDGLGASLASRPTIVASMIASVGVGLTLVWVCPARILVVGVGCAAAYLSPRLMSRRVNGVTGDILGASVLLVETIVVVTAALIGA